MVEGQPICQRRRSTVGAGLPAKAVYQSQICWLTHRNRGQARSYIWLLIWSEINHRASSPLLPCPPAIPQQLIHKATHSNCGQLPYLLEIKPRKSVTYSKQRVYFNLQDLLIKKQENLLTQKLS